MTDWDTHVPSPLEFDEASPRKMHRGPSSDQWIFDPYANDQESTATSDFKNAPPGSIVRHKLSACFSPDHTTSASSHKGSDDFSASSHKGSDDLSEGSFSKSYRNSMKNTRRLSRKNSLDAKENLVVRSPRELLIRKNFEVTLDSRRDEKLPKETILNLRELEKSWKNNFYKPLKMSRFNEAKDG